MVNEDLQEDAVKMVKAMMAAKSVEMREMLNDKTDITEILGKVMGGKLQDLADPELMFKMAIAQIDACIMQLQGAKELLIHAKKL